jgi:NADH-quinone oxidoreductase subunit L
MVTSGIYLITRMSELYVMIPEAMIVIASIGALTAIVAATIALTQYDIKRVLAYSTVSQLGYMFLALGAGGFTAAMFHVVTHAFFKACLFLGSGSVIHTMEHAEHELHEEGKDVHFDPQDMRNMGGLRKYMPSTYRTFMISTLAIAGIPPLAGFFSKDEILMMTFNAGFGEYAGMLYIGLWVIGMVTALLTALYMFRLTLRTFHGSFKLSQRFEKAKGAEKYLHESPSSMTIPLWVLAIAALVGGFIGVPNFIVSTFTHEAAHINLLHDWLHTVSASHDIILSHATEWILMLISILVAVGGMALGYQLYNADRGNASDQSLAAQFGVLYEIWSEKYNIDEIYEGYISRPLVRFSDRVLATFDMKVIDGTVNAVGGLTRLFGSLFRYLQTGVTSSYALALVVGVIIVLSILIV